MSMSTYSDRDYFDEKFSIIAKTLGDLNEKIDVLHKALYGNGHMGIVERIRNLEKNDRILFSALVLLLPIQIEESRDFLIGLLKSLLGL